MKGFVLAAGFGTRLAPLTQTVPKPMFPVGQVPLIGYALRLLAHHGITDVIVNLHHLGETLRRSLGDGARYGVSITYSDEAPEILDTGGGLKKMAASLDTTFVAVNSDTILDVDLGAVLAAHREAGALATMILREDKEQGGYGQIEIDATSQIRRIVGHAALGDSQERVLRSYMFSGVHVIEPRFLSYLPEGPSSVIRAGYMKALDAGESLHGFVTDGYWVDAGTPRRYFDANLDLLHGRAHHRSVEALPPAIRPGVFVHPTAQVAADAQLVPPVAIAAGARVGAGTTLGPDVVVSAGASVADGAELVRSIVLDGVQIGRERVVDQIAGEKERVPTQQDAKS